MEEYPTNDKENSEVLVANYLNEEHGADLVRLLNGYAEDPMGGGNKLSQYVIDNVVKELAAFPGAFSVLCYVDGKAVGLINCLPSFSTFRCKPVINIHDITVDASVRRGGICQQMLQKVQKIAQQRGCTKLSLEVLEGNEPAMQAYKKFGFTNYELDPAHGRAMFWEKTF